MSLPAPHCWCCCLPCSPRAVWANPSIFKCDPNTGADCVEFNDDGGDDPSTGEPDDDAGAGDAGATGDAGYKAGVTYYFRSLAPAKHVALGHFTGTPKDDVMLVNADGGVELWQVGVTTSVHRVARLLGSPVSGLNTLPRVDGSRSDVLFYFPTASGRLPEIHRGAAEADGGEALALLATIPTSMPPTTAHLIELNGAAPEELVTLEGQQIIVYANAGPGYQPVASYPVTATRMFTYTAYGNHYIVSGTSTQTSVVQVTPTLGFLDAGVVTTVPMSSIAIALFNSDAWLIGAQTDGGDAISYRVGEGLAPWAFTDSSGGPVNLASERAMDASSFACRTGLNLTVSVAIPDAGVYCYTPVSASGTTLAGDYDHIATLDPASLTAGDIDGDGKNDLAVAGNSGAGHVFIFGR